MAKNQKRTPNKEVTKVVTAGTTIRMEQPKSKRQPKQKVTVVVAQELNPVGGFFDFLRHHAIVGLSIGFIIGNQMSKLVTVIVDSFIDPLSKLLFGTALSQRTFTLQFHERVALFGWGAVISGLINLILLLIFIYLAFKFFQLEKLTEPKADDAN
jgi:large-conductance mechanosensitive channel